MLKLLVAYIVTPVGFKPTTFRTFSFQISVIDGIMIIDG